MIQTSLLTAFLSLLFIGCPSCYGQYLAQAPKGDKIATFNAMAPSSITRNISQDALCHSI
ncbi:MAG: hypothetical protein AAF694_09050 [Bacteroidota bacterium]